MEAVIVEELASAFRKADLAIFLKTHFGLDLERVATGDDYNEILHKVVDYFHRIRGGELPVLLLRAAQERPNRPSLLELATQLLTNPERTRPSFPVIIREPDRLMDDEGVYVLQQLVSELRRDLVTLERLVSETVISARYYNESADKRLVACEQEIEDFKQWRKLLEESRHRKTYYPSIYIRAVLVLGTLLLIGISVIISLQIMGVPSWLGG